MPRKTILIKLPITVIIDESPIVLGAAKAVKSSPSAPVLVNHVRSKIEEILTTYGFTTRNGEPFEERISTMNGGYSTYRYYFLNIDQGLVKLALDVRVSDHSGKPNFSSAKESTLNKDREKLDKVLPEFNDSEVKPVEYLDVANKEFDWGVQYSVGSTNDPDYKKPVDTEQEMLRIVEGKVAKIVSRYA